MHRVCQWLRLNLGKSGKVINFESLLTLINVDKRCHRLILDQAENQIPDTRDAYMLTIIFLLVVKFKTVLGFSLKIL